MRSHLILAALAACVLSPLTPADAATLRTKVAGTSTVSGTLSRTIIDISPPPGFRVASASYGVTVPIPDGAGAVAVATALIDSINSQLGPFGFTASFESPADSTFVLMSRASPFSSCDGGSVPGIDVHSGDLLVLVEHLGHACGLAARAPGASTPPVAERAVPLRPERTTGVPSVANCTVDAALAACPAGDLPFRATLRDAANSPVPAGSLILDFSQCTPLDACAEFLPTFDAMQADGLGEVAIPIAGRTSCAGPVQVRTDTGLLGNRTYVTLDQDGDGDADAADVAVLMSKGGTADPTGDLDGDGAVSGTCGVTGVLDDRVGGPPGFRVQRLWPTILQPGELATIELTNPLGTSLVVELFDVAGRRVLGESLGAMEPGPHRLLWRIPEGTRSGLYSLRFRTSVGERDSRSFIVR